MALGIVPLLLAGCFMSIDENAWAVDQRREHSSKDLARDVPVDAPRDRADLPNASDGRADAKVDSPRGDRESVEGPRLDTKKTDGAKADLMKTDLPKSDGPRPDAPKPDAPKVKVDLPKPDLAKPDTTFCGQLTLTLASAPDDGEITSPSFYPSGEGAQINMGHIGVVVWGYFRFALTQAIPSGAAITGAALTLRGSGSYQWGANKALEVLAELSADAPAVAGAADAPGSGASGRSVTSAVRWPASGGLSWQGGQDNTTPSLAPILQQVVTSKGGLASGSHIQLWIRGAQTSDGTVATDDFTATGYATHPARLTLSYCK
ncbi:MAG: hypothetical protein ACOY3Y_01555 [Acidobacteriota bacterium]